MRRAIVAAAAALLMGAPAFAQTPEAPATPIAPADPGPTCSGFAAAPALPDGASATQPQMTEGETQYQAWGQATLAKLQSCRDEIYALRAQVQAREQAFNATNASLRAVTETWQADVAEFNERNPQQRRRVR
ncbi:MAG: hypothetical protein K2P58_01580 [Hyphomonadaceae bacterium]|nr:hypothetical protein [Hyphomonadaceae bacterium]